MGTTACARAPASQALYAFGEDYNPRIEAARAEGNTNLVIVLENKPLAASKNFEALS